jgi:hypothetical protein
MPWWPGSRLDLHELKLDDVLCPSSTLEGTREWRLSGKLRPAIEFTDF